MIKKIKAAHHTLHSITDEDGNNFPVPFAVDSDEADVMVSQDGERALVAFLVHDTDYDCRDEDHAWEIIVLNRNYCDLDGAQKFAAAMGLVYDGDRTFSEPDPEDYEDDPDSMPRPNPDAMMLDVYIHSGAYIALSGSAGAARMPDRRWDVSRGVWIPGDELVEILEKLGPEEREKRREEMAQSAIDWWNSVECGDVWGAVVVLYDRVKSCDGTQTWEEVEDFKSYCDPVDIFGIVGLDGAQEELESLRNHWIKYFLEEEN